LPDLGGVGSGSTKGLRDFDEKIVPTIYAAWRETFPDNPVLVVVDKELNFDKPRYTG
jgi:hypothetical protein